MENTASVFCRAEIGLDAPSVVVEVHTGLGVPAFNLVGLPETAVRESRERVRAAITNSRFVFPSDRRLIVNLSPADLPKQGGRYDLPIALGILVARGLIPRKLVEGIEFIGELGLMGDIRPVGRVLSAALACVQVGRVLCLARGDIEEASLAKGIRLIPADYLYTLIGDLKKGAGNVCIVPQTAHGDGSQPVGGPDLVDVRGQAFARRALEVAAVGGLNLVMIGPPGSGKTMLASRLPGIQPVLSESEAIQTAQVHSLGSGGIDLDSWRRRPFRAPHHSASAVALIGGGSTPRPGEVSLAHNGVLFLDELPEFTRHTLDQLREPLESREVFIARARHRVRYPANFQLVAAMNPCPCGWSDEGSGRCRCTPDRIEGYRARVSGPLLDRIDLQIRVPAVPTEVLLRHDVVQESSAQVRARVQDARFFRQSRMCVRGAPVRPQQMIDALGAPALKLLRAAVERLRLTARSNHRLVGIARVLADMRGSDAIDESDIAEAVSFRYLDRREPS